jgi:hypothetical protein
MLSFHHQECFRFKEHNDFQPVEQPGPVSIWYVLEENAILATASIRRLGNRTA